MSCRFPPPNPSPGSSRTATERGYLGAAGLATAFALSAVLDTQFSLRVGRLQLHVRASIASAVYRCGTNSKAYQVACRKYWNFLHGTHISFEEILNAWRRRAQGVSLGLG